MSEERHVSRIEASDSPCTPETCEETICWVCEEPNPSWPCPSRRAQDAEAAIQRVREVCDLWQRRYDASIRHPSDIPAVAIIAVLNALGGTTMTERNARVEAADRQAVERVRALHKVCTETPLDEGGCEPGDCDEPVCTHDDALWPCATIQALEEEERAVAGMSEPACRAVLDSYDSQHRCSGGANHDGPHRCEVCTTTWTKP